MERSRRGLERGVPKPGVPEREAGAESLLGASWECGPASILVSGLWPPELRKQLPVDLSPLACGPLLWPPQETNKGLNCSHPAS